MDKKVILAVAGSGKTRTLINKLNRTEGFLIITYTISNYENIRQRILDKFHGELPRNIKLYKYFTFLMEFCYKPFLTNELRVKGYSWKKPPEFTFSLSRDDRNFYFTKSGYIYHNRLAKIIEQSGTYKKVNHRIAKHFDHFFIDEIQDFSAHDFNLLKLLCKAEVNILFVGDFYQYTYDTSTDGSVNRPLHKDLSKYIEEFENMGLTPDLTTLSKSHRCDEKICHFISNNLGITIESNKSNGAEVTYIDDQDKIDKIVNDDQIVKLFFQNQDKFDCRSINWGKSKGQNCYDDICVVMNIATGKQFKSNKLHEMNPKTRNKFYVACTRAKRNVYLVEETKLRKFKIRIAHSK